MQVIIDMAADIQEKPMTETAKHTDAGSELIDAIHGSVADAQRISYQLNDIAFALERVGMDRLADEISSIAEIVTIGPKAVQGAHGEKLSADLRDSEEFSGTMLKAILAGCIVAPKSARAEGKAGA